LKQKDYPGNGFSTELTEWTKFSGSGLQQEGKEHFRTFQDGVDSVLLIPLILLILSKLLDRWIRDYSTTEGAAHIEKNDGENRFISNKCQ
jgi:hypothetical protein